MLCTQHFVKAEEAEADEALSTLDATYNGLLPFVRIFFLEKSISQYNYSLKFEHKEDGSERGYVLVAPVRLIMYQVAGFLATYVLGLRCNAR